MEQAQRQRRLLSIFPTKQGCGLVVMDGDGNVLSENLVAWSSLVAALCPFKGEPMTVIIGECWRHRWVQAVVRTLLPEALVVSVRWNAPPFKADPSAGAIAIARHYLSRQNLL